MCNVASAAKETLRFARDLRRASLRSHSSRSRAAACCSSSVRRAILISEPSSRSPSCPSPPAEVLGFFVFRRGISGRGPIVGFRIDLGGGREGAARDWGISQHNVLPNSGGGGNATYRSPVTIPIRQDVQPARSHTLAARFLSVRSKCAAEFDGRILFPGRS